MNNLFTRLLAISFISAISCTASVAADLPRISISKEGVVVGGISVSEDGVVINGDNKETDFSAEQEGSVNVFNGDYTRGNFSGQNLAGAKFSNAQFTRAKFDGANLKGAVFENSDFTRASFVGACLYGAKFINSNFTRADMTNAVLSHSSNSYSNFTRAIMNNVERGAHCDDNSDGAVDELHNSSTTASRVEVTTADSIVSALLKGVDSSVSLTVNFASDSDQPRGRAHTQIGEISAALRAPGLSGTRILIEGHTDSNGSSDYNLDLSFRRASSVKRILVTQYGLDSQLLTVSGLGESRPIASNTTRNGRALNRRVTLVNRGFQNVE